MNKEIAMDWVAALRSGDYKQGTGQLRSAANEFCCLGVLCNVHAQTFPYGASLQKDPRSYMDNTSFLPAKLCEWAGMKSTSGRAAATTTKGIYIGSTSYHSLVDANDAGVPFTDIADWIEKNYERL